MIGKSSVSSGQFQTFYFEEFKKILQQTDVDFNKDLAGLGKEAKNMH